MWLTFTKAFALLLTMRMRQRIGFYLAPCLLDGVTYYGLVTTYEDDEFNPLFINTPLLDDEMGHSTLHILSAESFNVHFFDDNNRELLGYKAQNPNYSNFDKESYKLAPSSLETAYRIRDISHSWFMRRTLKDDSEAIREGLN